MVKTKKVFQLIQKYGTNDPFKIAKLSGILVVYEPLGSILGYYSKTHRSKVIHINNSLRNEQQLFTCAHELAHAVLHPDTNTAFLKSSTLYSTEKIEIEANTFAVDLLFPHGFGSAVTLDEAIDDYCIPEEILMKKFYS